MHTGKMRSKCEAKISKLTFGCFAPKQSILPKWARKTVASRDRAVQTLASDSITTVAMGQSGPPGTLSRRGPYASSSIPKSSCP